VESNGIPQRVEWNNSNTTAAGANRGTGSNTLGLGVPPQSTIDRSMTVGLEDGSVRASNGGEPNRLGVEVVSFTLKDSFQVGSRPNLGLDSKLVIIAYIDFVDFTESRRRFELLLVDVGCIYLKRLLYVC